MMQCMLHGIVLLSGKFKIGFAWIPYVSLPLALCSVTLVAIFLRFFSEWIGQCSTSKSPSLLFTCAACQ